MTTSMHDLRTTVSAWKKELDAMEGQINGIIRRVAFDELHELEKRFLSIVESRSNLVSEKHLESGFAAELQSDLDAMCITQERLYSLFCSAHRTVLSNKMFSLMTHRATTPSQ